MKTTCLKIQKNLLIFQKSIKFGWEKENRSMKAPKNIKIKLPEDIAKFREGMMTYDSVESRSAYLRLIKKKAEEYYKNNIDEYDWLEQDILKMIDKEINELKPDIEAERDVNKPLGWKYSEDVMELELDLYDTIEEQIEYLKNKLQEFDLDTINITTNEYDDIRNDFKIRIKNRQYLLAQNTNEKPLFSFDFQKIKKYANELQKDEGILYLKYVLKEFDREKRENFYFFMTEDEIKYFAEKIVITDPAKIYDPADSNMVGIGAKQSLAKENFEKNIKNELEFIKEKSKMLERQDGGKIEKYLAYGKECYLNTWKEDRIQLLSFEKKMTEKFGSEVEKFIVRIYTHIEKNINPIELIDCNIEKYRIDKNVVKTQTEISRINDYINELEKLEMLTNHESGIEDIPEDELDKLNEWQLYYINHIKDEQLKEWIDYLRRNRPGVYDKKFGENYKVDFEWVTENAIMELKNYRDKLENLERSGEKNIVKDENINQKNIYPDKETAQISNELANAHSIIKKQKNKISTLGKGITKNDLIDTIEKNNCRFKNGKINYSKLANILGYSNHTARKRCDYYGVK